MIAAVTAGDAADVAGAAEAASTYRPLDPRRLLDTRSGTGAPAVKVGAGGTVRLQVTGPAGSGLAPAGSTAVALNVTATNPTASGFVAVYPSGYAGGPNTSNLNFVAGQTTPNLVISKVAGDGTVTLYNANGTVDLIADLQGAYTPDTAGSTYRPLDPTRRLDTRSGTGAPAAKVGPGGTLRLQVTGPAGSGLAPIGSTAVTLNVTATNPTASGFVAVYPTGYAGGPNTSNLNFVAGQSTPNLVVSKVAGDGSLTLYNANGTVDLIADLQGAYTPDTAGSSYRPLDPSRRLDTRNGTGAPTAKVGAGGTVRLQVTGPAGSGLAPIGSTAVALNVTATNPTEGGFVAVYPTGYAGGPNTSNLNFAAGQTTPNLVVSKVAGDGSVTLYNANGTVDLIADLQGSFGGASITGDPMALSPAQPRVSYHDGGYTSASSLPGAAFLPWNDGRLTYRGTTSAEMVVDPDGSAWPKSITALARSQYGHGYGSQNTNGVEFMTDGQAFEFGVRSVQRNQAYRLLVDGQRVTDVAQQLIADSAFNGHEHRIRFDFGSAKPRRVTLELFFAPLFGIWTQGSTWRVSAYRDRTLVLGDSITGGSSQNAGEGIGTWLHRTALLVGWDDPWNQSLGGTGYLSGGPFGSGATFQNRVQADVLAYAPTRVVVWGGFNDNGGSQAAIGDAARKLYQTIRTGAPGAELIVLGCWSNRGTPAPSITATDETLRLAAASAGAPFLSPVTGKVYDAKGALVATRGTWTTDADAAGYLSGDGVHPNDAGQAHVARRVAAALQALAGR